MARRVLSLFMLRAVLSGWGDESSTWRRWIPSG